jgi:hypothetical protein
MCRQPYSGYATYAIGGGGSWARQVRVDHEKSG